MRIALKLIWVGAVMAAMILPVAAQDNTAAPTPEPTQQKQQTTFRKRQEREQKRIDRGVKNGDLTKGEAHHLESQHRQMNREAAHMRAQNGGTLTSADKATLHHQENRESHHIYRAKHNDRTRRR